MRFDLELDLPRLVVLGEQEPLVTALDVAFQRVVAKTEDVPTVLLLEAHLAHDRTHQIVQDPHRRHFEQ